MRRITDRFRSSIVISMDELAGRLEVTKNSPPRPAFGDGHQVPLTRVLRSSPTPSTRVTNSDPAVR
jgi:hypothetical protein